MRTLNGIIARQATLLEIFDVRWTVLRPGRPIETAHFPGDDDPQTIHAGAFKVDLNVACATFTRKDWQDQPAWQLRGMGVIKAFQNMGVGQLLLGELESLALAAAPIRLFWCNAREEALTFYERQGWVIASERFHVEDVGPHFKMTKSV